MARRKLIPGKVTLWDHEIAVDWADPEPGEPVDEDIMERVNFEFFLLEGIYICNCYFISLPQKIILYICLLSFL